MRARVPSIDADDIYGSQHVLDFREVIVRGERGNVLSVAVDDALHVVQFVGDVSGAGLVTANDAVQVARFATLLESGFGSSPLTDPRLLADVTGNGHINAADASMVARIAFRMDLAAKPSAGFDVAGRFNHETKVTKPSTASALVLVNAEGARPYQRSVDAVLGDGEFMTHRFDVVTVSLEDPLFGGWVEVIDLDHPVVNALLRGRARAR